MPFTKTSHIGPALDLLMAYCNKRSVKTEIRLQSAAQTASTVTTIPVSGEEIDQTGPSVLESVSLLCPTAHTNNVLHTQRKIYTTGVEADRGGAAGRVRSMETFIL